MHFRIFPLVLGSLLLGCGGTPSSETTSTPAAAAPEAAVAEAPGDAVPAVPADAVAESLDESVIANLAKADAKDGAEDKVVSKCALCALHMDGSDEHVVKAGEYSLHMCSAECKKHYEEDPSGSLAKLGEVVK